LQICSFLIIKFDFLQYNMHKTLFINYFYFRIIMRVNNLRSVA